MACRERRLSIGRFRHCKHSPSLLHSPASSKIVLLKKEYKEGDSTKSIHLRVFDMTDEE